MLGHIGLRQRGNARHLPVARGGVLTVARFTRHPIGAALNRSQCDARPGHHVLLHESNDLGPISLRAVRDDGIVRGVDHRRGLSVETHDNHTHRRDEGEEGRQRLPVRIGLNMGRPGKGGANAFAVHPGSWIARKELQQRRDLCALADPR